MAQGGFAAAKVLFKDYEQHVKKISERLRKASLSEYQKLGLPVVYAKRAFRVRSSDTDKEALAREIAAERKILSGPMCAWKCRAWSCITSAWSRHTAG